MRFNGTADSAIVYTGGGAASALDNIDYLTVSAWIKPDADMTASGEIFDKTSNGGQPTDGPDIWYEPAASNRLLFAQGFTGGNGYAVWYSDNAISPGQWQHVAVVYSRASASNNPIMYVNGAALTVAADVSFPAVGTAKDDSAHDTIIGAYGSANVAGFFKGLIDDVRVYNRILNASEVKQLYNLGR